MSFWCGWGRGARRALGALVCGLLIACGGSSGPAPDSGFLEEPERLSDQSDRFPFDRVWMAPDLVDPLPLAIIHLSSSSSSWKSSSSSS